MIIFNAIAVGENAVVERDGEIAIALGGENGQLSIHRDVRESTWAGAVSLREAASRASSTLMELWSDKETSERNRAEILERLFSRMDPEARRLALETLILKGLDISRPELR